MCIYLAQSTGVRHRFQTLLADKISLYIYIPSSMPHFGQINTKLSQEAVQIFLGFRKIWSFLRGLSLLCHDPWSYMLFQRTWAHFLTHKHILVYTCPLDSYVFMEGILHGGICKVLTLGNRGHEAPLQEMNRGKWQTPVENSDFTYCRTATLPD